MTALEHTVPQRFITRVEDLQLREDLSRKVHCGQTASGDDMLVAHRTPLLVVRGARVFRRMSSQVTQHVAGVPPAIQESRARKGECRATNGSNRGLGRDETNEKRVERGSRVRRALPHVAAW